MSTLIPDSIKSTPTESYDLTFKARLLGLNLSQLKVWVTTELNPVKLQLLLDMFGIDGNVFDFLSLNEVQRMSLFTLLIEIRRYSGTEWSIIEMAKALGATDATITYGYTFLRDGTALYDGTHYHDGGSAFSRFSITVNVTGVSAPAQALFEQNFRQLMKQWQPIRIHLKQIIFS